MLRQWLDANLPRIVEKAVRAELAESGKKKH
jgi:cell pole-organizing protein PopZ